MTTMQIGIVALGIIVILCAICAWLEIQSEQKRNKEMSEDQIHLDWDLEELNDGR
jgi:hypothetical protein